MSHARSMKMLREQGYMAQVVEKWLPIPGKKIRQDLFGFIDILAVHVTTGEVLAIQVTSRSGGNVSARVKKIQDSDKVAPLLLARWKILIYAWGKMASGRWELRIVNPLLGEGERE